MFWADKIADEVIRKYQNVIDSGEPIIVRDEKTASGRVHVGSLRSASLHAMVYEVLLERGIKTKFYFEINDFDPMDGIPGYLDESEYKKYMGVPLKNIPSPELGYDNFAELYGQEYVGVLKRIGFDVEVYRASELYLSGKMNEVIRMTLEKRDIIRKIYREISDSERGEDWYPINVICEKCGNLSATKITDFDGEMVGYICSSDTIEWAEGCGHEGRISPFDGNAKLPWKLDWAAKWKVMGVHFEGGGKDHYSKGGSRQVGEAISREVFDHEPPYGVFNEFFLVGGKKMSSSKGNAATAFEMAELLPPHILRLLLLKTPINRQINFDPSGDSIPVLFDTYDRFAEKVWSSVFDDDARVFKMSHLSGDRDIKERFLPRFSLIAFLVQMPHMQVVDEIAKVKGSALTEAEVKIVEERMYYASKWLTEYAGDEYKFELQDTVPEAAAQFTEDQKNALRQILRYIEVNEELDGQELHTEIHEIRKREDIEPKIFFSTIYQSFLGKDSGPKVGWFLSVLDRDFLIKRLTEVS